MSRPARAMSMIKLLALGAMPYAELMEVMGGDLREAKLAHDWLVSRGIVTTHGRGPGRLVGIAGDME